MAINNVIFNPTNDVRNAYLDWGLVLTKKEIPLPTPKTSTVDIKGADGVLDLSEVLTGDVQYNNRAIKLTFELVMDSWNYYDLISEISNYLHGKVVAFMLTDDNHYYYQGRASINSWECSYVKGTIVITVDAEPYKYEMIKSVFNITLDGTDKLVKLINLRMKVCPVIEVTGNDIVMVFNGNEYPLDAGKQQITDFVLSDGYNNVTFKGTGAVKITYRKGSL